MSNTGIFRRHFPDAIHCRLLGHSASLMLHVTNAVYMINLYKGEVLKDPDVAFFEKYQLRFLTVWNVYAQVIYASVGLSCDVLSLINEGKDSSMLKTLKAIRELFFSSIVFPIGCAVFTYFWSISAYDQRLLLPPGITNTLPKPCNHIIHTMILPIILWEVAFRPRNQPNSNILNIAVLFVFNTAFIASLYITYYESNQFPYPILNILWKYGTPFLHTFLALCFIGNHTFYFVQWYLNKLLLGENEIKKDK